MKPSNDLTQMNTPKVDNLGTSHPAIQYHIKGWPKFATLARHYAITYRPFLVHMVKDEPKQLLTHAVMQDYMAQIESVAGSRVWDKSPAIEVYANKKYLDQLKDDVMHHDLRMLEVEGFQTILTRYAGAIYNVNIRELKKRIISILGTKNPFCSSQLGVQYVHHCLSRGLSSLTRTFFYSS